MTEDYRQVLDGAPALDGGRLDTFLGATEKSCKESCPEAVEVLARRPLLIKWLNPKLPKKERVELELKKENLARIAHFKKVKAMQDHCQRFSRYQSFTRCCLNEKCMHCRDSPRVLQWYEGGPALKPIPPALRDDERPGHYLNPIQALQKYAELNYEPSRKDLKAPADLALEIYQRECAPPPHPGRRNPPRPPLLHHPPPPL